MSTPMNPHVHIAESPVKTRDLYIATIQFPLAKVKYFINKIKTSPYQYASCKNGVFWSVLHSLQ